MQISVYLEDSISDIDQMAIEEKLSQFKEVSYFEVITQQKALEMLKTQMAGFANELSEDQELIELIPLSYQVWLDQKIDPRERVSVTQQIAGNIKTWPGVVDVSYGQDWLNKYGNLVAVAKKISVFLAFLVLMTSILVFSNAIRAQVDSKRYEIEVLELIGATSAMIRRPFLIKGAVMGTTASLLALTMTYFSYLVLKNAMAGQGMFSTLAANFTFLNIWGTLFCLLCGCVVGILGSYLCVVKINTGWAAANR
ncbi:MAG: cell division protein FtsX [Bdellovibrionia bacterium]